jgi:hypothetical protein
VGEQRNVPAEILEHADAIEEVAKHLTAEDAHQAGAAYGLIVDDLNEIRRAVVHLGEADAPEAERHAAPKRSPMDGLAEGEREGAC